MDHRYVASGHETSDLIKEDAHLLNTLKRKKTTHRANRFIPSARHFSYGCVQKGSSRKAAAAWASGAYGGAREHAQVSKTPLAAFFNTPCSEATPSTAAARILSDSSISQLELIQRPLHQRSTVPPDSAHSLWPHIRLCRLGPPIPNDQKLLKWRLTHQNSS